MPRFDNLGANIFKNTWFVILSFAMVYFYCSIFVEGEPVYLTYSYLSREIHPDEYILLVPEEIYKILRFAIFFPIFSTTLVYFFSYYNNWNMFAGYFVIIISICAAAALLWRYIEYITMILGVCDDGFGGVGMCKDASTLLVNTATVSLQTAWVLIPIVHLFKTKFAPLSKI